MTILVTGATGTIGRHVTLQLAARGQASVRALSRDPAGTTLEADVEVVAGDLTDQATLDAALDGVTAMHLIAIGGDDYSPLASARQVMERARRAGVRRVTVLTGTPEELPVFEAVRDADVEWTHVTPVEFMANKLQWAPSIREEGVVRSAFGDTRAALVHEADVAAVIVAALTGDGHQGSTYTPTGPAVVSRVQAAEIIADVTRREIEFVELTRQQALEEMRAAGIGDDVADYVLDYEANPPAVAMTPTDVVEGVTGHRPRTFADWVAEHAEDFVTAAS